MKQIWRSLLLTIPLATLASLIFITTARAQSKITPDNSLGAESSVVTPNVTIKGLPSEQINGGATRGANLFHSFQEFNVDALRGAYFSNPAGIQNILTRVTGSNPSNILGKLGVLGNANLFFINPNGIIFGPSSSLDVNGSFFASTANSLVFTNGFEFSATNLQAPPLLTVNIPIGLRFRDNPGEIRVQGPGAVRDTNTQAVPSNLEAGLQVQPDQTLALVGGDVHLDGGIVTASGGRVELGAIAGAGTVGLNLVDNQLRLSIPDSVPRSNIFLTNAASVDVTGNGRGSVAVTAHNLDILGGSNISAGIALDPTPDSSPPGNITLNTTGLVTINYPSRVTNNVTVTNGRDKDTRTGNAGDITITAGDIFIDNRNTSTDYTPGDYIPAALQARSGGRGRAGNISLSTTGSINLIGQDFNDNANLISTDFVTSTIPGGGDITLKANGSISLNNAYLISAGGNGSGNILLSGKESVSITDNSFLDAGSPKGDSGNITIQSNGRVYIDRSSLGINVGDGPVAGDIPGNAGNINISGSSIFITRGSLVESTSEQEGLNSGKISLLATDRIEISGYDPFYNPECCTGNHNRPFVYTTLRTNTLQGSLGQAGDINVNTPTLIVSDGAILRSDSQNAYPGGNINVNAKVVELINGGQLFTNALSTGNAGNISIQNTERLVIDGTNPTFDQFSKKAQAFVQMDPQDDTKYQLGITIPQSGIFANTTSGQGGNITIDAPQLLLQLRRNAQISATAGSKGSGGNITINAPNGFIVAKPSENSDILANAIGGPGGNITIKATGIYGLENRTQQSPDPTISEINASSEFGSKGIVHINTPEVDPSRGLIELPVNVVDPTTLIAQNPCQKGVSSAFIITGRGGLPSNPNQVLVGDNVRVDLVTPASSQGNSPSTSVNLPSTTPTVKRLVPAQGWVFNDKGQVVLTAYDPTNTGSQRSWQEPASCAKR